MFINMTESLGLIMSSGTAGITGSWVGTLFMILLFLIVMALMFNMPLEFLAIFILPFCISVAAYYSNFMIPLIVLIIYISAIISRNFLFH